MFVACCSPRWLSRLSLPAQGPWKGGVGPSNQRNIHVLGKYISFVGRPIHIHGFDESNVI